MTTVFTGDVMIVEDNFIIAMDAEALIETLGAETVHHAATCEDALALLAAHPITAAILDFNLESGTSEPVAEAMDEAGTPFVFATGYSDRSVLPERFRDRPLLKKPYGTEEIAAAFEGLSGPDAAADAAPDATDD